MIDKFFKLDLISIFANFQINVGSATGVDLIKKESTIFSSNKNKSSQQPLGLHQPQNNKLKIRSKNCLESLFHSASDEDKETTWQQKRVSIKTLEGEFSVTMWASGADVEGQFKLHNKKLHPHTFTLYLYSFKAL